MNQRSVLIKTFFFLAAFVSLPACQNSDSNPAAEKTYTMASARLTKPVDSADLEKRLKDELIRRYEREYAMCKYYAGGYFGGGVPVTVADNTVVTAQNSGGAALTGTSVPHSDTNNQEQGVDEGDLVKTDGSSIFLARGSRFLILQATPTEQASVISDIDLKQLIRDLHFFDGRVAVISNLFAAYPLAATSISAPLYANPATLVRLYDVATPASPVLLETYEFPGSYQGSRRINGRLYIVTNYGIGLASPATAWNYLVTGYSDADSYAKACSQAFEENVKRIEGLTIADLLPKYTKTIGTAGSPESAPAVAYKDVYIPEFGNGTDLSLVISLDISGQPPAITSSGVLSSWCRVYMNTDSLYLASQNNWLWIQPMPDAASPVQNPEPRTAVHKFSVSGPDPKPGYRGSGIVDGWLNDRFSMSDYQGYLRIGTTRGGWWGETISNQLAVLAEDGNGLSEKGKITGLAKSERIYSMRFDRDRGYMVTFRQTDPLFTLDLSKPENPRVAGELKVNGFSTYIHLVGPDNTQLLTIGPSADDTGRLTGDNKLQLFDVSDIAKPALLASESLGQGWSSAVYDPHAFLYYQGLLTIPYFSYGYNIDGYTYQSGLNVFEIGSSSITKRGMITAPTVTTGYGSYQDMVDRSVIIGADIFSIAHRSVTVAGVEMLDVKKTIMLPESYSYSMVGVGIAAGGMGTGTAGKATGTAR